MFSNLESNKFKIKNYLDSLYLDIVLFDINIDIDDRSIILSLTINKLIYIDTSRNKCMYLIIIYKINFMYRLFNGINQCLLIEHLIRSV